VRPLNLGETLDKSINIVRARWRTLALVMVVVALPIQLVDLLIIRSTTDVYQVGTGFSTESGSATTYADQGAYVTGQLLIVVLGAVANLFGTVACYRVIAEGYLGRPTTARDSLRFAGDKLAAALWLTILMVVCLVPAFLLFVLPGVWLAVAWSVAVPVLLVEGHAGVAAVKRSFALVQDRWWATFGRLAVAYILVLVVTSVVTVALLAAAVSAIDDTSFAALALEHLASLLVSLVTTPFLAAVVTLVYLDLRARKEGFDLAGAGGVGGAPGSPPPPRSVRGWAPPVAPAPRRRPPDA
jgi:hypothetical protein